MAVAKPLELTEVPEGHQSYFRYDTQWQEPQPNQTRLHKMRTMVAALCPVCEVWWGVPVNDVRNWIRGRRPVRPGTHRKCKYPGKTITGEGYVKLWKPDHPNSQSKGYIMEHVFVMSEALGRPLERHESVHHIDGDRENNDLSNLQLRLGYHGKGQAWECRDCGGNNIRPVALKE